MPFAKIDENNRIIAWSNEKFPSFDTEFSNGDYVNTNCVDGVDDFIIEDGKAKFSPKPAKQVNKLKKELEEDDYIASKFLRSLVDRCYSFEDFMTILDEYRTEYGERVVDNNIKVIKINNLEEFID